MCQLKNTIIFIYFFTFGASIFSQTIFSDNGKFGIMDDGNNKVVIHAEYDKITEVFTGEFFGTEKTHSFILVKNRKYYFALKKWSKTSLDKETKDGWYSTPSHDSEETIEWEIMNEEFDTLFPFVKYQPLIVHKDFNIEDFETYND
jgi:hypothetical protein